MPPLRGTASHRWRSAVGGAHTPPRVAAGRIGCETKVLYWCPWLIIANAGLRSLYYYRYLY